MGACQAHSATHLIHEALHQILGPSALQAGSYNRPGYLRLDFSWNHAVSDDQRGQIELLSNEAIRSDLGVNAELMPLAEAKASGATALFGEVYGDVVRVVDIGAGWSRELCAGTHVASSSQVGLMAVNAESSVGSGIRRVEAFVGMEAFSQLAKERSLVLGLADTLKVQPDQLTTRVSRLVAQLKEAEREIAALKAKNLLSTLGDDSGRGGRGRRGNGDQPPRRRHRGRGPPQSRSRTARSTVGPAGRRHGPRRHRRQARRRRGDHRRGPPSRAPRRRAGPNRK